MATARDEARAVRTICSLPGACGVERSDERWVGWGQQRRERTAKRMITFGFAAVAAAAAAAAHNNDGAITTTIATTVR
eukprot:COSAG04_NODE_30526_length_262_cov_0.631902_1_plen_77_part_01